MRMVRSAILILVVFFSAVNALSCEKKIEQYEQQGLMLSAYGWLDEFFMWANISIPELLEKYCHPVDPDHYTCYMPQIDEDLLKNYSSAKSSGMDPALMYYSIEFVYGVWESVKLNMIWPLIIPAGCSETFVERLLAYSPLFTITPVGEKCQGVFDGFETSECFMGNELICEYSSENNQKNRISASEDLVVSYDDCKNSKSFSLSGMVTQVTYLQPNTNVYLTNPIDSFLIESKVGHTSSWAFASTREFASSSKIEHGVQFSCRNEGNVPCDVRIRVYFFGEKSPRASVA